MKFNVFIQNIYSNFHVNKKVSIITFFFLEWLKIWIKDVLTRAYLGRVGARLRIFLFRPPPENCHRNSIVALISLSFLVEVYAYDKLMDKTHMWQKNYIFSYVLIKVSLAVTFGSKISDFQIVLNSFFQIFPFSLQNLNLLPACLMHLYWVKILLPFLEQILFLA